MRRMSLAVLVFALAVAGPGFAAQIAFHPDQVITSARQAAQQGNHDAAISLLRSALVSRPNDEALRTELIEMLSLKERALSQQIAQLRREIASLRPGRSAPSISGTLAVVPQRNLRDIPGCGASFPVRVGGTIREPQKRKEVKPVYPPVAQSARVQGMVIVEAVIDCDGRIADARVLRGVPLLNDAALEAVRQWQYQPTLLNGVPVPVIMTVTVSFTLQ